MKASLKFREEQKPLFKSKVPISILGLPFQSGLTAGDTKELCLNLTTLFESGPSFRVSYRPNDSFNPFSLTVKSGVGHFGSPSNAPMTMSAEFNFLGNNGINFNSKSSINPRFMIHFKPNLGDFCVKKSQSSVISDFTAGGYEEEDGEMVEKPGVKITSLPLKRMVDRTVSGMELGAKTSLPIRNGVVLGFRWGVKFPSEVGFGLRGWFKDPTGRNVPRGVLLLSLNKIGIEHVAKVDKEVSANEVVTRGSGSKSGDLAEACFGMRREIETLRFENVALGKALEELKAEFGRGRKLVKSEGDGGSEVVV